MRVCLRSAHSNWNLFQNSSFVSTVSEICANDLDFERSTGCDQLTDCDSNTEAERTDLKDDQEKTNHSSGMVRFESFV